MRYSRLRVSMTTSGSTAGLDRVAVWPGPMVTVSRVATGVVLPSRGHPASLRVPESTVTVRSGRSVSSAPRVDDETDHPVPGPAVELARPSPSMPCFRVADRFRSGLVQQSPRREGNGLAGKREKDAHRQQQNAIPSGQSIKRVSRNAIQRASWLAEPALVG